ncbi:DUF4013 domain-containing protein [Haloarcula rara]|uniref:DUF4013 domain-containing protein n=1 Tax=Haloarcula rara TaxID=3033387 RepID=UPI0023E775AE|nr:DUF4013 domain-containing protein [Halomicroarcula sp. SHR3]
MAQDTTQDFEDAIRYPWTGDRNVERIAIGGLLGMFGFLFVPILFVYGYNLRVLRNVMAGETETAPAFDDWGALLGDGLSAFVIGAVYFGVPFLLVAVGWIASFFAFFAGAGIGGDGAASAGALLGFFGLFVVQLLAGVLFLVAGYLLPGAVAAYVRTDTLGAAFSPSTVRTIVTNRDYAIAWLFAFAINMLAGLATNVAMVTIVGILFVPFISFYGQVACTYAIGRGVAEIPLDGDSDEEWTANQPTA